MNGVERHLASARRSAQVLLARHPLVYERLLRAAGRGSLEKRTFLRLLRLGDLAVDVGANAGYFTLLFSDIVGASGEVHAFEPVAPTFDRLTRMIRSDRQFDNVTLNCAACGDVDGIATMMVPGGDWGQAALVRHDAGSWASAENVTRYQTPIVRLDRYVASRRFAKVDFVKLDAEGAELGVLKGLADTIARYRPLLSIEIYSEWTRAFGYEPADLVRLVESLGYDVLIALGNESRRVTGVVASSLAVGQSLNLVCGMRDVHATRLERLNPRP